MKLNWENSVEFLPLMVLMFSAGCGADASRSTVQANYTHGSTRLAAVLGKEDLP